MAIIYHMINLLSLIHKPAPGLTPDLAPKQRRYAWIRKSLLKKYGYDFIHHALACLFIAGLSLNSPNDAQADKLRHDPLEKITIDADYMRLNIETGESVYTGNVKITQGELVLTGDEVTLMQKENELER